MGSAFLPHRDEVPGVHVHVGDSIPAVEHRGARGGRRIPVAVVWRPCGSGLFGRLMHGGQTALWPWVQWHCGNGKMRYMRAAEWIARHGDQWGPHV